MRKLLLRGDVWSLVPHALADNFDSFEQQVQLACVDLIAVQHCEGPSLQALVQQPEPARLPDQQLHPVSAPIEEGEDVA